MDNDSILAYMLENERKRYEYAKEFQKTLRWAILSILLCVTICACFYMYYVVPSEDVTVDGNSKVVMESSVNGSNLWQ